MNISEQRRKEMMTFLDGIQKEYDDEESLRAVNEIKNYITEKKYGLVWEEHSEEVDEMLIDNIPIFKEVEGKKIISDEKIGINFLLEGDNLHSLKLLEKTHKDKIDVIYIDPPYNTKNKEFVYNDTRIGEDDGYRHSKWLSFMNRRLIIAKKLMSKDGVIFINIDENEVHQLKLLCDEIFDETNYIGEFIWKARAGRGGTTSLISVEHESILCYAKNKDLVNFYMDVNVSENEKTEQLRQWGQAVHREDRPTMFFPIFHNPKTQVWSLPTEDEISMLIEKKENESIKDGSVKFDDINLELIIDKYKQDGYNHYLPVINSKYGRWRRGYYGVQELIDENLLTISRNTVRRIIPGGNITKTAVSSFLDTSVGTSAVGTKEIKELFNNIKVFDTTKPLNLVSYLINLGTYNKKNAIVLDFFAGSGTTGHAVKLLNQKDSGNRKYILCTDNENNICEDITHERLKKIQENLPHNLKYYRTNFIDKFSNDDISIKEQMLKFIKTLIELENHLEIDGIGNIIVNKEEDIIEFLEQANNNANFFITSDLMLSQEEKAIANKKNIKIIVIPEYYYSSELREVGEI